MTQDRVAYAHTDHEAEAAKSDPITKRRINNRRVGNIQRKFRLREVVEA